jgi:arylsulfatase
MPTFLELARLEYPRVYNGKRLRPVDGKSLVPILRSGSREGHDLLFWEHEGKRAVRQRDWKLVSASGGEWELYNMVEDRAEMNDLSGQNPEKAAELKKLYEDWARENNILPWNEVKALNRINR